MVPESDTTYPLIISPWLLDISEHPDSVLHFEIANLSDEPLEIEIVDEPDDMFVLDLPLYIDAGATLSCELSLLPGAGVQKFTKSFTIELSDSSRSRFTVPVRRIL